MAKPTYRVWVINLVNIGDTVTAPDGPYTVWTQALLDDTCAKLKGLFDLTCNHPLSQFSSTDVTSASLAAVTAGIRPGELVVRLTTKKASLIAKKYAASVEATGGTVDTQGNGVISECWIEASAGSSQYTPLIARLAFHELMHNKYDASDSKKDLHKDDGQGLAVGADSPTPDSIKWDSKLTESNRRLMAPLLGKLVTQCTLTSLP